MDGRLAATLGGWCRWGSHNRTILTLLLCTSAPSCMHSLMPRAPGQRVMAPCTRGSRRPSRPHGQALHLVCVCFCACQRAGGTDPSALS